MQFDDAGLLTARVRWYRAPPNAVYLPFPHLFGSNRWQPALFTDQQGPGEVPETNPTYDKGATPSWATGSGRFCGSQDWWQNGTPSNAPPVVLGPDGQPSCCVSSYIDLEPVRYKWRAKTFGCMPWRAFGPPAGVAVRNLTTSTTWTLDVNTTTALRARDPAHTSNFVSAAALGSCQGFDGTSASITFTFGGLPQTGNLKLLSWNPVNGRSVWQVPTTFQIYGGQFFAITRPLS